MDRFPGNSLDRIILLVNKRLVGWTITLYLARTVQRELEGLATRKGQAIEIIADDLFQQAVEGASQDNINAPTVFPANEKALAALRQITHMQKGMRHTDGSQTDRLIREGRAGAM